MTSKLIKLVLVIVFLISGMLTVSAQSPCPNVGPCDVIPTPTLTPVVSGTPVQNQVDAAMSFAESLTDFTNQSIVARGLFINQVEKPLSGYFYTLAQLIALIMFSWAIAQMITTQGGFSPGDISRIGLRCAVGFLLLFFAGDVDGDGVRGDLINYPAGVGYYYAYGVSKNGQVEGSFLNKEVTKQETSFNDQYKKFTENKLMVKVAGRDMPVKYPTMKDVNLLSSLYTGKPLNDQELAEAKSRSWQMSMLFGSLNFSRGVLAFADFFLFFISGFGTLVLRLALPLMIGAFFHKEYGQKMTTGFFWTAFVWTIVFPGMCQFLRLIAYSAGNVALGLGGQNSYYTFDATTGAIVSSGNPETLVVICSLYMLFAALCLFAAFFLSMYLCQGKILEGIISTTSAWFTAATSTGVSVVTGAVASRMNMEADNTTNKATRDASMTEAGFQKTIAENSAKNSNETSKMSAEATAKSQLIEAGANKKAEDMMTGASYQNAAIGAYAGFVDKVAGARTEAYQSKANALMNYRQEWDNLGSRERQEKMGNLLDYWAKNGDAQMKERIQAIKDHPEELDALGKEMDMYLKNGVPIVGSGLNALGINGDALNTWLRTDAGKYALGTMLSGGKDTTSGLMTMNTQFDTENGFAGLLGDKSLTKARQEDAANAMKNEQQQQETQPEYAPNPNYQQPQQTRQSQQRKGMNPSRKIPTGKGNLNASQLATASILNDEMIQLGYTPQARQVLLGEFGRENSFNRSVIANGHIDDANGKRNAGIISWQGDRLDRLYNFMQKQGFVKQNGTFVDSEGALRAQVHFMDNELRTGGKSFNLTHRMLTNPTFKQKDISSRMGGKSGYIGYNNTDPKYNNAGDPNFASPITAKWAEKSFSLVAATSKPGSLQFGATQQFGKANKALGDISSANPVQAKIIAAQRARMIERDFQLEQNKRIFDGKNIIATQYYTDQRNIATNKINDSNQIADKVYGQRVNTAETSYGYSMQGAEVMRDAGYGASSVRLQGKVESVKTSYDNQYAVSDMNYNNEMKNAALAYQSRDVASQVQFDAATKASHLRAMSQMMQNIGSSAGHQISEASEKFSRL